MTDLAGLGAKLLSLDVTDDVSMRAAVDTVLSAEGRIDALVNNAGYGSYWSR
jgi:NAD(P)-dependent dehydrogenase (short-subunit alcohol dehydrogenase family)